MSRLIQAATIAAFVAAAPLTTACNRAPDVKERVDRSLEQAKIENVNVDYDPEAKVVHLKGTVQSATERQRAEQVAATAVGTSGTVLNELTVEGMNEDTADNRDGEIRDRLNEMVDNNPLLKDRDINFEVNNGVVTVKGTVRSADEKAQVSDLVKAAPGVKDFVNELEVEPQAQ